MFSFVSGSRHVGHTQHASRPQHCLGINFAGFSKEMERLFLSYFPQIIPAGNMPTYGKKYQNNSRLVICNLQPTKQAIIFIVIKHTLPQSLCSDAQDKKADLCIHTYVDDVMRMLMERLELDVPEYDPVFDPVKQVTSTNYGCSIMDMFL